MQASDDGKSVAMGTVCRAGALVGASERRTGSMIRDAIAHTVVDGRLTGLSMGRLKELAYEVKLGDHNGEAVGVVIVGLFVWSSNN